MKRLIWLLLIAGCATTQTIPLHIDPPDASVYIDGRLVGIAMNGASVTLDAQQHYLTISKDGYLPLNFTLVKQSQVGTCMAAAWVPISTTSAYDGAIPCSRFRPDRIDATMTLAPSANEPPKGNESNGQ